LATAPETGAAWPELAAMQVKIIPAINDNPTKRFIEFSPVGLPKLVFHVASLAF
jgi:hypothetical protein